MSLRQKNGINIDRGMGDHELDKMFLFLAILFTGAFAQNSTSSKVPTYWCKPNGQPDEVSGSLESRNDRSFSNGMWLFTCNGFVPFVILAGFTVVCIGCVVCIYHSRVCERKKPPLPLNITV